MKKMHDSGKRQQFQGGGVRDTAEGKPHVELLDPYFLKVLGEHNSKYFLLTFVADFMISKNISYLMTMAVNFMEDDGWIDLCNWLHQGSIKYDPWNWAKGMPVSRAVESLIRHIFQYINKENDENHKAAILCNIMFINRYMTIKGYEKWRDLPNYLEPWKE